MRLTSQLQLGKCATCTTLRVSSCYGFGSRSVTWRRRPSLRSNARFPRTMEALPGGGVVCKSSDSSLSDPVTSKKPEDNGKNGSGRVDEESSLPELEEILNSDAPQNGASSIPGEEQGKTQSGEAWQRRWGIVILCFTAFMLCNMDRVNMSIAILPMSEQYMWDSQIKGLVQSSFFWGYLLTQVIGGIWADRFGGKAVLGFGVLWWSLATLLTPVAAKMGLPVLLAARACMGIGEGVAMPAMNNLLSRWVPVQERSRSLAFVYSGMFVGSILGLGVSPHMIDTFAWPSVFYVFGVIGIAWYFGWDRLASSSPKDDPTISASEKKYIIANAPSQEPVEKIPWKLLLSRKEVWAIIICHFCHNWGTFILLTWMPTYYNQVLGLDLMQSGLFSVLPWVTMSLSANLGGWIADSLVPKVGVTTVRKVMQSIGFLGPAFFLTQLCRVDTVPLAVGCMMCSQGLDAFSQSGLYSNHQDIGPKYAGVLLGMSNTAGVLAGVFGTYATGYILQNGSWDQVWGVAVSLYLVGTLVWNLFATGEQIFD
ncbi:hypothetical protein BSKO_09914 [Bryopsis sp. KO-2023]|nr:hypothetical protein BSKO_09914 [Bryopsis sp. KO-2023]